MMGSEVRGGGRKSMPQQLTAWPLDLLNIGMGLVALVLPVVGLYSMGQMVSCAITLEFHCQSVE